MSSPLWPISAIQAGTGNAIQDLSFIFNTLGSLTQRVDAATSTTDTLSTMELTA